MITRVYTHRHAHVCTCTHDMEEQAELMTKGTKCTAQKGSRSRKEWEAWREYVQCKV